MNSGTKTHRYVTVSLAVLSGWLLLALTFSWVNAAEEKQTHLATDADTPVTVTAKEPIPQHTAALAPASSLVPWQNQEFAALQPHAAPLLQTITPPQPGITLAGDDVILTWPPVVDAVQYNIYRSPTPYFLPDAPYATVSTTSYTDTNTVATQSSLYYQVTAVDSQGAESAAAHEVGMMPITLHPGFNLLSLPLLPADTGLDAILGTQLFGTADPQTADRVLVWNGASQTYDSAWFCGGPVCETFGEDFYNRWLANDYSQSSLTLEPDNGFWLQNRSGVTETLVLVGQVAGTVRSVSIGDDWQMLGAAFPDARSLDAATIPATGTADPQTADRILYWDAITQSYDSAWYCGGPVCETFGDDYYNHWLANDYSQSPIILQPGHGFWFQNRNEPLTWQSGPVEGAPELSISKSDNGAIGLPGERISYTLTYSNTGGLAATGVVLTETVPANTSFDAGSSPAGWSQVGSSSQYTYSVGTLNVNETGQVDFVVTVDEPLPTGAETITNTASIGDDGIHGIDQQPSNSTTETNTPVSTGPTEVCGTIATNTTWQRTASPYILTCEVKINNLATLTIESGVEIQAETDGQLTVNGSLILDGNSTHPIVFTSHQATPQAGDWPGLCFDETSSGSVLEYVTIEYAGADMNCGDIVGTWQVGIYSEAQTLTVTNSTIQHIRGSGLYIDDSDATIVLTNSLITDTNSASIFIPRAAQVIIDGNQIIENGKQIIFLTNISQATITNNEVSSTEAEYLLLADTATIPGLSVSGNGVSGSAIHAIRLNGSDARGNWPNFNIPYVVYGDMTVVEGVTLTLNPGVRVEVEDASDFVDIRIYGTLLAQGNPASPIVFTSHQSTPQAGDWPGLCFDETSSGSILTHVTIEYAGADTGCKLGTVGTWQVGIYSEAQTLTVTNSTIQHIRGSGLYIDDSDATIVLTNSLITDTNSASIFIPRAAQVIIDGNQIIENGKQIIFLTNIPQATITNNEVSSTEAEYLLLADTGTIPGLSVSGNGVSGSAIHAIRLISNDARGNWPNFNIPYVVYGDMTVVEGATLTLNPGVRVEVEDAGDSVDIRIYGTLLAQGNPASPIVFTSHQATPQAGDWPGLCFDETSSGSILSYVTIEYAGADTGCKLGIAGTWQVGIYSEAQTLTVSNSKIRFGRGVGISLDGINTTVSIVGNQINNNSSVGVFMASGSSGSISITDNQIHSNNNYGILNLRGEVIIAKNNWWGDATGPYPYGAGNGINYSLENCVGSDCEFIPKVIVDPWVGIENNYGSGIPYQAYASDPVNTANGNYTYQQTDLAIDTRSLPLAFARSYNSTAPADGPLGYGWTHSYYVTAEESSVDGSVTIHHGDGRSTRFTWDGSSYQPPPGVFTILQKNSSLFSLTFKDQTIYQFDSLGRLATIQDRNGSATSLSYSGTQLTTITAPDGRSLTLAYGGDGRISTIIDPLGRTLTYTYDINGDLATVTDVTGATTSFTYDANHRLSSITDANGHTFLSNVYNDLGRVTEQLDAQGNLTTFVYDIPNHTTYVTDALGRTTTYQYDAQLRLISQTDALGNSLSYTYDADNNRIQAVDKRGNIANYEYDTMGNLMVMTDTLGFISSYTYDSFNNLLSQTDAEGGSQSYSYDANHNLTSITDPLGQTTTYTYNSFGQPLSETNPLGHTTSFGYDALGYQSVITDALGFVTSFSYDAGGRLLNETDPLGNSTSYSYDNANRLLSRTDAAGETTSYSYDAVGNRLSVTSPNGGVTTLTYDAKDQLISRTDPLSRTTTFAYDAVGNQISVTNPLSQTTSYGYDALNRRLTVTDPLGNVTTTGYDANGNRISLTDANGNVTSYSYDARNLLITVTDAEDGVVSYSYDGNGNRLSLTDANGNVTTYEYDALNRLVSSTDPLGFIVSSSYDAAGNQSSQAKADGTLISYSYDPRNMLTETSYPGGSIQYEYDAVGNRTVMTDTVGGTTYGYDNLYRLTTVTGPNGTLSYGYDANGNRTSLTYPDGRVVSNTYDLANQLLTVNDSDAGVSSYSYDDNGQQTGLTLANGVTTSHSYDAAGWLTSISHTSPVSGTITFTQYSLDAVGNRTIMTDTMGVTTYSYDSLYRLTEVSYPDGETVSYAYDPMGNRTAMTSTVHGVTSYNYDVGDRLLDFTDTTGTTNLTWDDNGNLMSQGGTTYTFDPLDRLTQVISGTTMVQYQYNGDGVRLTKTVDGTTTTYVQDVGSPLPVVLTESSNGQTTSYLYGNDLLAQLDPADVPSYYHSDGLGSTVALTNPAGQWTDRYSYDVFGTTRSHQGSSDQTFTFVGEQVDEEVGLVFLRARYYDSAIGRFISKDQFMGFSIDTQSFSKYSYVQGNPISLKDESGYFTLSFTFEGFFNFYALGGNINSIGKAYSGRKDFYQETQQVQERLTDYYNVSDPDWAEKWTNEYRYYNPAEDVNKLYMMGVDDVLLNTPGVYWKSGGIKPNPISVNPYKGIRKLGINSIWKLWGPDRLDSYIYSEDYSNNDLYFSSPSSSK